MGKLAKAVIGMTVTVLVLMAIGTWLLTSNIDGIVKKVIQEVGSETLDTDVSLDNVVISLKDARGALIGLNIANPKGFKSAHAFQLGSIDIDLDAKSLTGDEVVMPSIIIDQAALTFEQSGTATNLQTLLNNINSTDTSGSDNSGNDSAEDVLIVIEELQLTGATMTVISDQLPKSLDVTLPDITLKDIGRRGAGVTPEQAAGLIIKPILKQAETAAKNRITDKLKDLTIEKIGEEKDKFLDSAKKKLFGK
ncbi:MAG: hypothetical protein GY746_00975 [Gammaproteobacteria bacterium]|nr:hypothetical protein [Gammaproteobacteria bacterium]MCP4275107.1 hypothetical protein [Gammaproteobacteria bacterium]MCP4927498.1 hypothetical protein [Gammaproteobacteria bacterium]